MAVPEWVKRRRDEMVCLFSIVWSVSMSIVFFTVGL
jgi:hypothetical protein